MYNFSYRNIVKKTFCLAVGLLISNLSCAQKIGGYVFLDSNNNEIMDHNEKGLKGVLVSNQKDVVTTDSNGHFQIKLIEGNFIFVTKPESYQFKLDEYNNPEFYFLYKKQETKEELKYPGLKPLEEVPDVLYFPVYENFNEQEHSCLLLGDLQMKNDEELNYYKDGVIPFLANREADFYVELGDIADNNLEIHSKEKQISATLGIPGYRATGNHDMNFMALDNTYANETFKKVYGPDYYSFDYGSFHYIILNNIIYDGLWQELNTPGKYNGGLTFEQIKWLENDLNNVSTEKTIVVFSHIPFLNFQVTKKSTTELFKALENHKKIFAVSGHLHSIQSYDYSKEQGWEYDSEFEGLVAGAVCGAWWSGSLDENDIPFSTCYDGSPKGFFQLNVMNKDYNYIFHPVNYPSDYQLRTYIEDDEIWVNWFVGKPTDTVWVYLNNGSQALTLENFKGSDPFIVAGIKRRMKSNTELKGVPKTSHLWKVKIPRDLEPGYHSVRVKAKDSKGKLFSGFKAFYLEE